MGCEARRLRRGGLFCVSARSLGVFWVPAHLKLSVICRFDYFSDVTLRVLTSVLLEFRCPGSRPVSRSNDLLTPEEVNDLLSNPLFDGSALRGAGRWIPLNSSFSSEATSNGKDSGRLMLQVPGEVENADVSTGSVTGHPIFEKLHAISARRLVAIEIILRVNFQPQIIQKHIALLVNSKASVKAQPSSSPVLLFHAATCTALPVAHIAPGIRSR